VLKLEKLNKVFRANDVETTALNEVNLRISAGEFIAVTGPSGCGKSTLLNILGLLDSPTSGTYRFMDKDVSKYSERERAHLRKSGVGFVFQSFNLISELSVHANVELPLLYQKIAPAERRRRVESVLEKVGVASRRDHLPKQLSGGQQQRVAVARAIVGKPQLILADEPTGNLDSANGEEVMHMLMALHAEGSTIVMVTHSPLHAQFAQRTIRMLDGRILSESRTPLAELVA